MKNGSLLIFKNLWEGVKDLSVEQRGEIFSALCTLVYEDTEAIPADANARFVYNFYKKIVLENQKKYAEISLKRSLARTSGTKQNKTEQTETNENKEEQNSTKIDKKQQNSDLLCKEKENKNKNKKENKKEKENKESAPALAGAVREFNSQLSNKLPLVVVFNDKRKQKLKSRFEEFKQFGNADEVWQTIIDKVKNSRFLCGEAGDWKCSFDWLVENSTNWLKVYEGHYDNKTRGNWQGAEYSENEWK